MRTILTLVLVLALCAPLSAFGSSSSPPLSAKAELAAMRSAANSQHSLHYVSVSSAPQEELRIVADVGMKEGIQRITVTDHGTTGPAAAIVSGRKVYIRGNAFTLQVYFGFAAVKAKLYAGTWISVPSSRTGYATLAADVTFPSFISHLFPPRTKLSLVPAGTLIGVRGTAHAQSGADGTATLFAPAHGKPLPVKETAETSKRRGTGVVTMSHWNEAVHVKAPRHAVPITQVIAG